VPEWEGYSTTTFGLACFRQINAEELLNKTDDVTRSSVQKAVVILSSEPILGAVRNKLGLVTKSFFEQRDFSKVEILDVRNMSWVPVVFKCSNYPFQDIVHQPSKRLLHASFRCPT
jgi:hypothetical protein